jgi:hypothetical protein
MAARYMTTNTGELSDLEVLAEIPDRYVPAVVAGV